MRKLKAISSIKIANVVIKAAKDDQIVLINFRLQEVLYLIQAHWLFKHHYPVMTGYFKRFTHDAVVESTVYSALKLPLGSDREITDLIKTPSLATKTRERIPQLSVKEKKTDDYVELLKITKKLLTTDLVTLDKAVSLSHSQSLEDYGAPTDSRMRQHISSNQFLTDILKS